jgi:type IV pilus assembly protein PilQ
VVVKRAAHLKPEVTRRGSLLIMDFPRTGELAARPPVLSAEEEAGLASGSARSVADASALSAEGLPGQGAPPASLPPVAPEASFAALDVPADPASIDPPAAIAILNEGGLMDGKEYVGRRISLDFKDVAVADVLRLIAEVSDLNVIAGDEVQGNVTIRLVDVPWDQALDVILLTKGLGFMRVGNVLRIAPSDVLAQEEELRLQERRAKEKLEDLVVKLQPVNYADVADVSKMVGQLLTPRGSVNTDTRTNTLIIKDIASVIDEATALVKAVDTMTPQVMIEARIVEAKLDFSREFGAVWAFGTNPLTEGSLGGRDFIFRDGASNIAVGNPITANPTGLVNLAATVLDSKFNIDAQLQAAEVNGDGKVISSPRIVTLDNSEASIEQGVSIPFQTFENGDAQLEFVDAVLQLKVTPHITSDKSIIMVIEVSRNAPDDSVFTLTGSPAIAKNQVKTETLVKDGQTLVLGGIYVVDKSERQSRVPYLHKIPFLGAAFRSNEISDGRQELLIFVTPRVVTTPTAAS